MTDAELVLAFVERRDQGAFAGIVERYADLVYAAAVRQVPDAGLAEDVTEAVFIVLARRARVVEAGLLAGWLIKVARLTALAALRKETRRRVRERKAAAMRRDMQTEMKPDGSSAWERLSPVVDAGLARLGN